VAFAYVVRMNRRRLSLSQEELAARSGISVRALRKIESSRTSMPRPFTVRLLADAFGLRGEERSAFYRMAAEPPPSEVPAQLPADVPALAGRSGELVALTRALDEARARRPAYMPILAVSGAAGVGKTTLAVHWAHRVADQFPGGQLFADLRGIGPGTPVTPLDALRGFLAGLGVPAAEIPADPGRATVLYRTRAARRRVLVVLDNACDAEQVRPLLPGSPGSVAVVTSRRRLTGLIAADGARPVDLGLLSGADAASLLASRLGHDRLAADPAGTDRIVGYCAGLPLALVVIAARAATAPDVPLRHLVEELGVDTGRLAPITGNDDPATDLRSILSWSYRALSPAAGRLFRLLGLHPAGDFGAAAAAGLADRPLPAVRGWLAELAGARLLDESRNGRYAVHDLVRAYAAELVNDTEPDAERRAAVLRLAEHYLRRVSSAEQRLHPHGEAIRVLETRPGQVAAALRSHHKTLALLTTDAHTLGEVVRLAAGWHLDEQAQRLATAAAGFAERQADRHHWVDRQVGAAGGGDTVAAHRGIASAYSWLGRIEEAEAHLNRALRLARGANTRAMIHLGLCTLRDLQDDPRGAFDHAVRAAELFDRLGHRPGEDYARETAGWYRARLRPVDEPAQPGRDSRHGAEAG